MGFEMAELRLGCYEEPAASTYFSVGTIFNKYTCRYQPMTLLPKNSAPEMMPINDPINTPYTSQPNDPRMMDMRIQWSDFRKLEIMMKVAARYEVPDKRMPSNRKYAARVFIMRNSASHHLFVEKMATPKRAAPIVAIAVPVNALNRKK